MEYGVKVFCKEMFICNFPVMQQYDGNILRVVLHHTTIFLIVFLNSAPRCVGN